MQDPPCRAPTAEGPRAHGVGSTDRNRHRWPGFTSHDRTLESWHCHMKKNGRTSPTKRLDKSIMISVEERPMSKFKGNPEIARGTKQVATLGGFVHALALCAGC